MDTETDTFAAFAVATTAIILLLLNKKKKIKRRKNRRIWVRSWIARRPQRGIHSNLLEELRIEDKKTYMNYLRMDEATFNYILSKVSPLITKQDTHFRKSISARDRLLATLRYLATGETYSNLQFSTRIPQCTLSGIIPETCRAIYHTLKNCHLVVPNTEAQWKKIANDFQEQWNVYNCIGALDGKHIRITCPPNSGSHFYNYKLFHSIVLLALADANYKFLFVDVGTNGRIGDSGVYSKSKLRQCLNNRSILNIPPEKALPNTNLSLPFVVIADDAFPLSYNIMKPYALRNISREEKIFNYRPSRGRRVVESAFGILANRFRVLLSSINLSPEKAQDIVLACCTLQNVLIDKNPRRYLDNLNEEERDFENLTPVSTQNRESTLHGAEIRGHFKNFYNHAGSVPWQDDKI